MVDWVIVLISDRSMSFSSLRQGFHLPEVEYLLIAEYRLDK